MKSSASYLQSRKCVIVSNTLRALLHASINSRIRNMNNLGHYTHRNIFLRTPTPTPKKRVHFAGTPLFLGILHLFCPKRCATGTHPFFGVCAWGTPFFGACWCHHTPHTGRAALHMDWTGPPAGFSRRPSRLAGNSPLATEYMYSMANGEFLVGHRLHVPGGRKGVPRGPQSQQ